MQYLPTFVLFIRMTYSVHHIDANDMEHTIINIVSDQVIYVTYGGSNGQKLFKKVLINNLYTF